MIILSIETSCDETAISIVEVAGDFPTAEYKVLSNTLFSQIETHKLYGGVFPALAKREHIATVLPLLKQALAEADFSPTEIKPLNPTSEQQNFLEDLLAREGDLATELLGFSVSYGIPPIDVIAITTGPGLEPALWVGVNFAKALSYLWQVKVVPVDHMEGHIFASLFTGTALALVEFPALSLLISGGHTELILMKDWRQYEKVGSTRDDAVGEAFDKVARLLGLSYPGGPEIGRRASEARAAALPPFATLPRPMLHSGDLDFSFSGLKTAVRYAVANRTLTEDEINAVARDFENAVVEVLISKLKTAIQQFNIQTVIIGGGVSANHFLRQQLNQFQAQSDFSHLPIFLPPPGMSTDNSLMIALAGHANLDKALSSTDFIQNIRADGNKSLS